MKRRIQRPSGAYKLLVMLLYGSFPSCIQTSSGRVEITSIRKLARFLGTESKRVRGWLSWLEDHGYLEQLTLSTNHRVAQFRIRTP